MSVLLDACAVVALFKGEPAAKEVWPILENGEALVHPVSLGEVIDRMARLTAADPDDIEADVAMMGVSTVRTNDSILVDAGRWRARHYHRVDRSVSLADCVAGLCSVSMGLPLATSDAHCVAMVKAEGGSVYALPNSRGIRPT